MDNGDIEVVNANKAAFLLPDDIANRAKISDQRDELG